MLNIQNLSITYRRGKTLIPALRNVSLDLLPGKTLGIAGESGCGKSSLALAIPRLLSAKEAAISGKIIFEGRDLLSLPEQKIRELRGDQIGFVFQDPFTSLNPVIRIGAQVAETILAHQKITRAQTRAIILELFSHVKLDDAERIYNAYPHQLSGGQRQRIMIAMAIANRPKLLIADEPTTALDVTIQKEILDLLAALQKELGMSMILVSHHLGIMAQYSDELMILYGGEVMEMGATKNILSAPLHPYTDCLLKAIPGGKHSRPKEPLLNIPGAPPDPAALPTGCVFHPRCPKAMTECKTQTPELRKLADRKMACWLKVQ